MDGKEMLLLWSLAPAFCVRQMSKLALKAREGKLAPCLTGCCTGQTLPGQHSRAVPYGMSIEEPVLSKKGRTDVTLTGKIKTAGFGIKGKVELIAAQLSFFLDPDPGL